MSLARFWGFLAVALPVLAALIAPMSTVDLAYQLRAGAEIRVSGSIPAFDTWTHAAAGLPWWDQQWGAQVALSAVFDAAGWSGLVLLRAALTGLAFALLLAAVRLRGAGPRTAALVVIVAFVLSSPALALRPQLFGVVAFALTLALLSARRSHPGAVLLVPLVAVAWANLHGSFVLAPLVVGWAWLDDLADRAPRARWTLASGLATLPATAITPWGPGVWEYAVGLSANAELARRVSEWQPPSPVDPVGIAFLLSLAGVAALVAWRWRAGRRLSLPSLAWLAGLAILGLRAIRGLAWWPLGAAVALAPLLARERSGETGAAVAAPAQVTPPAFARLNLAVAAVLVLAGIALLPSWRHADPLTGPDGLLRDAPGGVTMALREAASPGDRLYHPQRWGSWFEWAVPGLPTFLDSRIEIFPVEAWADDDAIRSGAPGWEAVLDRRGITLAAVAPGDGLADRLGAAGWTEVYRGDDGDVFAAPDRGEASVARRIGAGATWSGIDR